MSAGAVTVRSSARPGLPSPPLRSAVASAVACIRTSAWSWVRIPLPAAACRTSRRSRDRLTWRLARSSPGRAGIRLPGLQEPLKVVPSAADGMAGHPQEHQNGPDDEHNYPDSPENGDFEDEAYDEENNAKNNHVRLPEIRESIDP
jgi:hypothetical protein